MKWRVTTVKKFEWTHEVEADTEEEAKEKGDAMCELPAHDSWVYDTEAEELEEEPHDH